MKRKITGIFLLTTISLYCQGGGPPPPGLPDPPEFSIDRYLILLFLAAVLFGIFVIKKKTF